MTIFDITEGKLNISDNFEQIIQFYVAKNYGDPKFVKNFLSNSDCIFIYKAGKNIVGAIRTISDKTRFVYLVDLFVGKKFRGQGIGTSLLKKACAYYSNLKVCRIWINTDPADANLPEFYTKAGFKKFAGSEVFYFS
ncbi:MAG: GNAT family N-acetyltransferase [Patescibacteria group bacterium]|jgi:ribosomal protein S18 acetylase RimI-like enzyme